MNPFDWKIKFNIEESNKLEESELTPFESHVQEVMNDIGISTYWYDWGPIPFKLSLYTRLNDSSDIFPMFSGISERQKKLIELTERWIHLTGCGGKSGEPSISITLTNDMKWIAEIYSYMTFNPTLV